MKGKIQGIIGLLIIGFLVFGAIKSIYNRNFADPEFRILKSAQISSPIKNALFWHEEELEKTSTINSKLSAEESFFIDPLYDDLKTTGMVIEQIRTMSEKATKEMIALDAYRGTEPDVWEIAKKNGNPYIFKIIITGATAKERTKDLESVKYLFSLYDTSIKSLLWEAESTRVAGFFGGMPESEKSISALKKYLKESKIIE
ncbi:hypothetical protein LZQ00_06920 [Sphingobacterium sp. SRCM116780]|uniref:hypothetical protein n=1 Tax=Sphingobacterium sp. SRCM116780 TaxID=2907623 RepID=UPI001F2A7F73|nr:hypothetical protein [Sphingobacterium sp. SRCM116780]UIR57544.1 hypothetical protein LZQ00_06920 [Sphingobacterium sp. SRCM116780]